jgi:putative transposase
MSTIFDVQLSQTPLRSILEGIGVQRKYEYRRKLPHRQWEGKAYFITFSTYQRQLLTPGSRDLVLKTCLAGNGRLFELHAVVVMPDHVHLILTPLMDEKGEISIPEIMQAIKSTSAHLINRYLGRKGRVWQEESFDRAMRQVENFQGKIEYILGNPVRASLATSPFEYRWLWKE